MSDDIRFYVLEDGWQILVLDRFYNHEVAKTFYQACGLARTAAGRRGARSKADAFCAGLNRDEQEAMAA